jgi:hypothetical protein
MNESALKRLRRKARGEVEWKVEAFRKEHIEKENITSLINWSHLCRTICFMCTYNKRN